MLFDLAFPLPNKICRYYNECGGTEVDLARWHIDRIATHSNGDGCRNVIVTSTSLDGILAPRVVRTIFFQLVDVSFPRDSRPSNSCGTHIKK